LIGTVVGSFLNVCIYRIPWEKSVIWPGSRCPNCYSRIAARDNLPIVSWIALRGECRQCGAPISPRYPLVEALVGVLFLGVYLVDVIAPAGGPWGQISSIQLVGAVEHAVFLALLVAATFIDYDLMIIPDEITITGMVIGVGVGTLWPQVRPVPSNAVTPWQGFWDGLLGLLVGAGLTWGVRIITRLVLTVFRHMGRTELTEGLGLGDVTLMGMIGALLGWRATVLTFFLASFYGLAHAVWKLLRYFRKRSGGGQSSSADHEMPFGPYLSMAAATLVFVWPWLWRVWAKDVFGQLYEIFWWMFFNEYKERPY
jgi:leader peptidase (prepilin peptidase)/N-methyltransferase